MHVSIDENWNWENYYLSHMFELTNCIFEAKNKLLRLWIESDVYRFYAAVIAKLKLTLAFFKILVEIKQVSEWRDVCF